LVHLRLGAGTHHGQRRRHDFVERPTARWRSVRAR
jgi:hypothetical protein